MGSNAGSDELAGRDERASPEVVEATLKSLEILRNLKEEGSATLTELASRLGYAKSTVYRHLATLESAGYVSETTGRYRIGFLYLDYGIHVREQNRLYQVAKPMIDDLSEDLEEKVWLMAEENGFGVFLYHETPPHGVQTFTRDGYRAPLHAFAAGKAILAHISADRVEKIVSRRELTGLTEATITDENVLFEELERIRERGTAFNRTEAIQRVHGVGVPILDEEEQPIGALSVAGPANRLKGKYFEEELPELLLGVANEIEVTLAYE